MGLRYDEKGKFFTEFISKTEIPVTIQTATNLIRGFVYVRKGERLSDELNSSGSFIPVADATIFDTNGEKRYKCEFLAVHRDHIIWLMPEEEDPGEKSKDSGGDS
jgi:Family of unknown function (DUF6812)